MRLLFSVVIILFVVSCDNNRVYDEYVNIPNSVWGKENAVKFEFALDDTLSSNHIFIKVRNNINYPYSNLYLFTKVNFPDGKVLIDTLEYEMTNAEGVWLGSGLSGLKSNLLYYKKNVVFYEKGNYSLSIQHGMRTDNLDGIQDIGVRIERN